MSFLTPFALLSAAIIGPIIVAMYLLKLRREDRRVSSTFLWQRIVRDVEANAPWQKLRRNLLLLLQLLLLLLRVLLLLRLLLPGLLMGIRCRRQRGRARYDKQGEARHARGEAEAMHGFRQGVRSHLSTLGSCSARSPRQGWAAKEAGR